jgi:GNAT superfamily N-acetyltransferase
MVQKMKESALGDILVVRYNQADSALRNQIAWLQHRAAPTSVPIPVEPLPPEHDPALDAISYLLRVGDQIVSYAAIVQKSIVHAGESYRIAGLSCVATDLAYQSQGLGTHVVAAATQAIVASDADIGIFTCDWELTAFYERAGNWQVMHNVTLVASHDSQALTSSSLKKAVLMRLLSPKAQAAQILLTNGTISLDLPIGQFW